MTHNKLRHIVLVCLDHFLFLLHILTQNSIWKKEDKTFQTLLFSIINEKIQFLNCFSSINCNKLTFQILLNSFSYDFFLILSDSTFKEDNHSLANKIRELKKPFFFVRTKIDVDIYNNQKRKGKPEEETKATVRKNIEDNLNEKTPQRNQKIYLISNFDKDLYDFPRLVVDVAKCLPEIKQQVLTFSLRSFSTEILHLKMKHLRKRAWIASLKSGLAGLIPVPGLSFPINIGIMISEFKFYRDQLIVPLVKDQGSFRINGPDNFARWYFENIDIPAALKYIKGAASRMGVVEGSLLVCGMIGDEVLKFIPFVGSILGAASSFTTMVIILRQRIKDVGEEAELHLKGMSEEELKTIVHNY